MRNINIMIKPASSLCNMRCKYCFYADEAAIRSNASYGIMTEDVLEAMVKRIFASAEQSVSFVFQGGEPTMAGKGYFQKFLELVSTYNTKNIQTSFAIQTNGLAMDAEWAQLFAENHFLVGLSVDGTAAIHDSLRPDAAGEGTFARVMNAAKLLEEYKIDFNILTVITRFTAKNAREIYEFYTRKMGWRYMQFIPCLDGFEEERGTSSYSLTPKLYARFLKDLFDVWYQDVAKGDIPYIRYFDNLFGIMMGMPPESCGFMGGCYAQLVLESDGSVYPCDFYVMDDYRMGSIVDSTVEELLRTPEALQFRQACFPPPAECMSCQYAPICRAGCRRDRDRKGTVGSNYYCEAFKDFFSYAGDRFRTVCEMYARLENR